jgi:hypothetical protein
VLQISWQQSKVTVHVDNQHFFDIQLSCDRQMVFNGKKVQINISKAKRKRKKKKDGGF